MKRLEQKIDRAETESALRIGEAVIGSQDDDKNGISRLTQVADHFQPVHFRHFQVCDDERGMQPLHGLQPLFSICGLPDDHAVERRPVHRKHDALADHFLVLHDEHPQHWESLLPAGSTAMMHAPPPAVLFSRRRPKRSP